MRTCEAYVYVSQICFFMVPSRSRNNGPLQSLRAIHFQFYIVSSNVFHNDIYIYTFITSDSFVKRKRYERTIRLICTYKEPCAFNYLYPKSLKIDSYSTMQTIVTSTWRHVQGSI